MLIVPALILGCGGDRRGCLTGVAVHDDLYSSCRRKGVISIYFGGRWEKSYWVVGVDGEYGAVWFGENLKHGVRAVSDGAGREIFTDFLLFQTFLIKLWF